jgi:hypothetical protein
MTHAEKLRLISIAAGLDPDRVEGEPGEESIDLYALAGYEKAKELGYAPSRSYTYNRDATGLYSTVFGIHLDDGYWIGWMMQSGWLPQPFDGEPVSFKTGQAWDDLIP